MSTDSIYYVAGDTITFTVRYHIDGSNDSPNVYVYAKNADASITMVGDYTVAVPADATAKIGDDNYYTAEFKAVVNSVTGTALNGITVGFKNMPNG